MPRGQSWNYSTLSSCPCPSIQLNFIRASNCWQSFYKDGPDTAGVLVKTTRDDRLLENFATWTELQHHRTLSQIIIDSHLSESRLPERTDVYFSVTK
jgi:hypothetical protein